MKLSLILSLIGLLVLGACETVPNREFQPNEGLGLYDREVSDSPNPEPFCGDGSCQESENRCSCPRDCGACTGNVSDISYWACVDGVCKIAIREGTCGNERCEQGELGICDDCPDCDDRDICTQDSYDFQAQSCRHEAITPCCGDGVCAQGESYTCLSDCPSAITLGDYPYPFVENGTFQAHLIVGSKGRFQPELIIASISLMNGLDFDEVAPTYATEAKLDTEIASIERRNVILVGSPCQNSYVKELMPYTGSCDEAIPPGGLIRLFKTGPDTYALAVMGRSGTEVRTVGRFLEGRPLMSGVEVTP